MPIMRPPDASEVKVESFPQFLRLPIEVRRAIYRHAYPTMRVVPVFFHGHLAYKCKDGPHHVKTHSNPILGVCRESREEAKTCYKEYFRDAETFNPTPVLMNMSTDTLLIYTKPSLFGSSLTHDWEVATAVWQRHLQRFIRYMSLEDRSAVQHLAIDFRQTEGAIIHPEEIGRPREPKNLHLLPCLKTLSVVTHPELSQPNFVKGYMVEQRCTMNPKGPLKIIPLQRTGSDKAEPNSEGPAWESGVKFEYVYLRDLGSARLPGYTDTMLSNASKEGSTCQENNCTRHGGVSSSDTN